MPLPNAWFVSSLLMISHNKFAWAHMQTGMRKQTADDGWPSN